MCVPILALHVIMLQFYQCHNVTFLSVINLCSENLPILDSFSANTSGYILLKIKPTCVIKELCQLWHDLIKNVRLDTELCVHVKSLWHSCIWIPFLSSASAPLRKLMWHLVEQLLSFFLILYKLSLLPSYEIN